MEPSQQELPDVTDRAAELRERVARDGATVRALQEHLAGTVDPRVDPGLDPGGPWLGLGEHLRYRLSRLEGPDVDLSLAGRLDPAGAHRLDLLLHDLHAAGGRCLLVDVGALEDLCSLGLATLLRAQASAVAAGGDLALTGCSDAVVARLRQDRCGCLCAD